MEIHLLFFLVIEHKKYATNFFCLYDFILLFLFFVHNKKNCHRYGIQSVTSFLSPGGIFLFVARTPILSRFGLTGSVLLMSCLLWLRSLWYSSRGMNTNSVDMVI